MTAQTYAKLVPTPNQDTQAYWDALRQRRLTIQACAKCGVKRHYPRPVCDRCHSMEVTWVEASGRGTVHSWTVAHHPFHAGFKGEVPYTLVTVDLEEGVRMQAQLKGADGVQIKIGTPVEVRFETATEDLMLPYFVMARA